MGLCAQKHTKGCCPEHCNPTQTYITHLCFKSPFLWFLQYLFKSKKVKTKKHESAKKEKETACKERMIKKDKLQQNPQVAV
jgi:hypothetical protein